LQDNNRPSPAEDLALLASAARSAGAIALRYFQQSPKVWLKPGNSPVSEADLAVDDFLKAILLKERPHYGWISEESIDDRPTQPYERYFVIDPIDGTRGFLSGKRQWCISLAIVENGQPIAGVLKCPALDEFYEASLHAGAKLNGERLETAPNRCAHLPLLSSPAVITNKLPPEFLEKVELVASAPSLAYRLAMLAKAALDIVLIRPDCHDWDIAAADIILLESGARLVDYRGITVQYGQAPFSHRFLMAFRKPQLKTMLDIVAAAKLS